MHQTASCDSSIVQVVPEFVDRSTEARDMMSIAQDTDSPLLASSGLILHDGPTINAGRMGTIPWGALLQVDPEPGGIFTDEGATGICIVSPTTIRMKIDIG